MFDPWVTRDLRIRDLLTHRSGLPACGGDQLWLGNSPRAEIIRRIRFLEPTAPFRTRFQYQNLMFLVAGEMVPAVSASSWDAMLRQRIFEPLCMQRSNSSVKDLMGLENVAAPHEVVGDRLVPIAYDDTDGVAPAGAINSSVIDMAQWMRLQLSGGVRDGKTILSPRVIREMHSMQMPVGISEEQEERFGTRFAGYGLGWELSDYRGVKIISHGGGLSGMFSRQTLVPEMGLGVVVMTNQAPNRLCGALIYTILDAYAGGPTKDWIAEYQTMDREQAARDEKKGRELHEQRVKGTSPSHPLESYTGLYRDRFSGDAHLDLRDGQLFFFYNSRCLGPLEHWHYDTFRVNWQHPIFDMDPKTFLTFTINEAGHIGGLTVTFYHPTHFEKVGEPLVQVQSP
jgi:CubicO group peptidase (beta-lactamase class C family)